MRVGLVALIVVVALVPVGFATAVNGMALPKLHGTVGPGYTISLKNARGIAVKTLKPGKYTFIVKDKANIHNFTLKGPGVKNKTITGTTFEGTKTVTLTVKKGTYRYYCTVHPTLVTRTFKVS